jgi:cytochrome b6-f complex iron-sulfur subunit
MSAAAVLAVAIVLALAVLFVVTTAARRDRANALGGGLREARRRDRGAPPIEEDEAHVTGREVERAAALERSGSVALAPAPAPPRAPMDDDTLGVTRRQFFNRGIVTMFALGLSGFGAACLGFLWPSLSGGFGSKIKVGKLDDILQQIESKREPFYVAEARTWISAYPAEDAKKPAAKKVYSGAVLTGMENGVVALYQKCVHLGCRVPWCKSSQWFECPCHGSKYNRVGEKKGGPAPRGLDRFAVEVDGGVLVVDTKQVVQGPPIGTNTTGQEQEGPHCA